MSVGKRTEKRERERNETETKAQIWFEVLFPKHGQIKINFSKIEHHRHTCEHTHAADAVDAFSLLSAGERGRGEKQTNE